MRPMTLRDLQYQIRRDLLRYARLMRGRVPAGEVLASEAFDGVRLSLVVAVDEESRIVEPEETDNATNSHLLAA